MSPVRPATTDDIPELVRLRGLMFASFTDWGPAPDGDGGLAACGVGAIDHGLPSPYNPRGTVGHLFGMVTDPRYRKRGHAKAIMTELLRWFDDQCVGRVDLTASKDGVELYRGVGFVASPDPFMKRMRPWKPGD